MKKIAVFMTGVLAVASLLVLMSSCKKDCTCTYTYTKDEAKKHDSDVFMELDFPANHDAKDCKELTKKLEKNLDEDYYKEVTCK